MKAALWCIAILAYFAVFAMLLIGLAFGNHCSDGPCLTDQAWRIRIVLILIGGLILFFGIVFAISRIGKRPPIERQKKR